MTLRERVGGKRYRGRALPVFSVDTEKQGNYLIHTLCQRSYDEPPRMILAGFKGELSDMRRTSEFLRDMTQLMFNSGEGRLEAMRERLARYRAGEEGESVKGATKSKKEHAAPQNPIVARKVDRVMTVVKNVTDPEFGCTPEMREAVLREVVRRVEKELAS